MFRKEVANKFKSKENSFRHRSHEVKRIEAFSDAVFAFAVTLLIVSLEVPKNFEELASTVIDRVLDLCGLEQKTYRWGEK